MTGRARALLGRRPGFLLGAGRALGYFLGERPAGAGQLMETLHAFDQAERNPAVLITVTNVVKHDAIAS